MKSSQGMQHCAIKCKILENQNAWEWKLHYCDCTCAFNVNWRIFATIPKTHMHLLIGFSHYEDFIKNC